MVFGGPTADRKGLAMALAGVMSTRKLMEVLSGSGGVSDAVAALSVKENLALPQISPQQIMAQNAAAELSERSSGSKYPMVFVYCNKLVNQLKEKFRVFSGQAHMVIEARLSHDRIEDLEPSVQAYVDAITRVLDQNRGDWGDGVFYGGEYEVSFGGVKHGGLNFMQIAKLSLVLEISTD